MLVGKARLTEHGPEFKSGTLLVLAWRSPPSIKVRLGPGRRGTKILPPAFVDLAHCNISPHQKPSAAGWSSSKLGKNSPSFSRASLIEASLDDSGGPRRSSAGKPRRTQSHRVGSSALGMLQQRETSGLIDGLATNRRPSSRCFARYFRLPVVMTAAVSPYRPAL